MVAITVSVAVMIMTVPPVPIALLVFFRKMPVIAMRVNVGFDHPLVVIAPLMFIPTVTVMIARIACVVVVRTAGGRKRQHQSRAYQ